jgi:hypothetical protein
MEVSEKETPELVDSGAGEEDKRERCDEPPLKGVGIPARRGDSRCSPEAHSVGPLSILSSSRQQHRSHIGIRQVGS